MLTLTRTTKTIVHQGKTLSESFTQVLPICTDKPADEAMSELVRNRVIKSQTMWFASDDWNLKPDKYFPTGAGEYQYEFVDSPKTEKRFMVLVNTGFSDYYNDEYTRNGDCEFFCGPYPDFETARAEAVKLMDSFTYEDWAEENDIPVSDEYEYHCEGKYTSMKVVEIDVMP